MVLRWLLELCEEKSKNWREAEERIGAVPTFSSKRWETAHLSESGLWISESECLFFLYRHTITITKKDSPCVFHHPTRMSSDMPLSIQIEVMQISDSQLFQKTARNTWLMQQYGVQGLNILTSKSALSSLQWCYNYPALSPASCLLHCTLANNPGIIKNMKAFFRIMSETRMMFFSSITPLSPSCY